MRTRPVLRYERGMTDRETVADWVGRYITAWDSNEPADVRALFAPDAEYRWNPWDDPVVGADAITAAWLDHRDEPGDAVFTWETVAVDGDVAVVRGRTDYAATADDPAVQYANLWLVRFDGQGRARSFTEWWMTPRGQQG